MSRMCEGLCAVAFAFGAWGCGSSEPGARVEGTRLDTDATSLPSVSGTEAALRGARGAVLRDASGAQVGTVTFLRSGRYTGVGVSLRLPSLEPGIHGFHIHANDDPENGAGCIADPAEPPETHFVSADGHYNPDGATHGDHSGDMPALLATDEHSAAMSFITDLWTPSELAGRAVIVHAGPDNYGNVPIGSAPKEYTPNSEEAVTLTHTTGNAGNRLVCGVVR